MKVSAKLQRAHAEPGAPATVSFEYFVPKTAQGMQNLYDRMDRMYKMNPTFIDVTWNAGGVGSSLTAEMVYTAQHVIGVDTVMHLTCAGMDTETVDKALDDAFAAGCQNILALRGDEPKVLPGQEPVKSDFKHAKDLIRHIREKYGDHFDIGVAAYPEGHPEEPDPDVLIKYLKEKVDAGATFAVTQMFYDVDLFLAWVDRCRAAGINIPLIPGIMPISGWASFLRRAKWCEINIPPAFLRELEPLNADDAAIRDKGCELVADMCKKMVAAGIKHLHFYTMNLEKATTMVLEKLDILDQLLEDGKQEPLPWRQSLGLGRENEGVRPIFWRNRKHSYVSRTAEWDEFPNGRWGDARSPAFGELERYGVLLRHAPDKAREMWGAPTTGAELGELIVRYLDGGVAALPWSDDPVGAEVGVIRDELARLNRAGFYTINSQPAVNGARSNHPRHGWGPANGYVYQKAYLELLVPAATFDALLPVLRCDPMVTYYGVSSRAGTPVVTNSPGEEDVNAITWGIFPGQEVQQPTVVEREAFLAWKDEAFRLALEWASFHAEGSATREFLSDVGSSWYLVNIVHNDFQDTGAIWRLFDAVQLNGAAPAPAPPPAKAAKLAAEQAQQAAPPA